MTKKKTKKEKLSEIAKTRKRNNGRFVAMNEGERLCKRCGLLVKEEETWCDFCKQEHDV